MLQLIKFPIGISWIQTQHACTFLDLTFGFDFLRTLFPFSQIFLSASVSGKSVELCRPQLSVIFFPCHVSILQSVQVFLDNHAWKSGGVAPVMMFFLQKPSVSGKSVELRRPQYGVFSWFRLYCRAPKFSFATHAWESGGVVPVMMFYFRTRLCPESQWGCADHSTVYFSLVTTLPQSVHAYLGTHV